MRAAGDRAQEKHAKNPLQENIYKETKMRASRIQRSERDKN